MTTYGRFDLTDEQWTLIEPLLPPKKDKGRRPADRRKVLNGMLWILSTGAGWRDLPERYGPWKTVYGYFRRWRIDGTFDRIVAALQLRLDAQGYIDWQLWYIDGSVVRAHKAAAGAKKKAGA
jgi:transposase